jgi:hypothetical protein
MALMRRKQRKTTLFQPHLIDSAAPLLLQTQEIGLGNPSFVMRRPIYLRRIFNPNLTGHHLTKAMMRRLKQPHVEHARLNSNNAE